MTRQKLTPEQEKLLGLSDEAQRALAHVTEIARGTETSDLRLVSIARTQFELGFMALNKAVCDPENGVSTERDFGGDVNTLGNITNKV